MKKSTKAVISVIEMIISILLGFIIYSIAILHYGKYFIFSNNDTLCFELGSYGKSCSIIIIIEFSMIFFLIFHTVSTFLIKIYEKKLESNRPFEVTDYNVFEDVEDASDYRDGFYENAEAFNNSGIKQKNHKVMGILIFFLVINIFVCYIAYSDITILKEDRIIYREPLHPFGNEYYYTETDSFTIKPDKNVNPEIVLNMSDGIQLSVSYSDNIFTADEYKENYDLLIEIDNILKKCYVTKNISYNKDDFKYYSEEESYQLNILLTN